jgi:glycogen phosphorylase
MAYTNHTLHARGARALAGLPLFQRVLPRHAADHFRDQHAPHARRCRGEVAGRGSIARNACISLIEEGYRRQVDPHGQPRRWSAATPSTAWPRSTRNCSRKTSSREFAALYPEKFNNKTNGITPRRWLLALPTARISALITSKIGDGWARDLSQLSQAGEAHAG